jgi:hypothetical protein
LPRIIIQTDGTEERAGVVTLAERLVPADARNDHYLEQLVERLGWALMDAEELEGT